MSYLDAGVDRVLDRMLVILDAPEKWTQGAPARLKDGQAVSAYYPGATCFCLDSARDLALASTDRADGVSMALWERFENVAGKGMVDFNDDPATTYDDVVRVLKTARGI